MSELKAYRFWGQDEVWPDANFGSDYYLKSEVDKVIAEKNKEIAELKEQIEVLKHQACKMDCMTVKLYNEACDDIIHQKYKRCLAMANYWVAVSYQCVDDKHRQRAERHHYKWLEIAEKFKPNKEAE